MAAAKQPKSILKKTSYPAQPSTKAGRDRETALYHANLLQQRKDIELEILLSTEQLIDYPLAGPPYDAVNPSPSDTATLKKLLQPFQPSDYDALILERNINEHCGYALCPNRRVKDGGSGAYRLVGKNGKAKDFKVVTREELERWCSEPCAKRALYLRVQLSETPAWERGAILPSSELDLLDEPKSSEANVVDGMKQLHIGPNTASEESQDVANLALERGVRANAARDNLVEVKIQENIIKRTAEAPSLSSNDLNERLETMHLTLEGHTPHFEPGRTRRTEESEEGSMDWDV